jgi:dihydroorotate dehydrogenase
MVYGFKIVEEMISGLSNWMDEKGYRTLDEFVGKATSASVAISASMSVPSRTA